MNWATKNFLFLIKSSVKFSIFLSIIILNPLAALSQTASRYDSLDTARDKMYNQSLPEALKILDKLDKNYPLDEDIMVLYSQALYWSNDFSRTIAYIKTSTIKASYPEYINFHFGKILFDLSYLKDANKHLSLYLEKNPQDAETLLMLAKISYWQGKSSNEILNKINAILINDPQHAQAKELKEEILLSTAPELSLAGSYFEDSQPLQGNLLSANLRFYQNAWLQPSVQILSRYYQGGEQVMMPSISNKTYLSKSKTELELRAGAFTNSWSDDIIPTWTVGLKQKTFKNIDFAAEVSRAPYLYTLASINENVVPTILSTSIGRETALGMTGKIMAQQWQFNDGNKVNSLSAWILIPVINQTFLTFNMGYAFTVADSDQNRFILDETVDLPSTVAFGQVLPGVFNPYFTPQNQIVHAALGKIDLKISQKVSASINSNIGIYARIDNPNYVYYGTTSPTLPNANPRNPHTAPPLEEELVFNDIFKIFVPTRYFPLDLRGKLMMDVNRTLSLHSEYAYIETIFFKSQEINMGLKWRLASR